MSRSRLDDRPQQYTRNRHGAEGGRKRLKKIRENWYQIFCKVAPSKGGMFARASTILGVAPGNFAMVNRPGRMLGKGVMQFITELQEEATHNLQLRIDRVDANER